MDLVVAGGATFDEQMKAFNKLFGAFKSFICEEIERNTLFKPVTKVVPTNINCNYILARSGAHLVTEGNQGRGADFLTALSAISITILLSI